MISKSRLRRARRRLVERAKLKNVDGDFDGAPVRDFHFGMNSCAKFRPEQVYPAIFGGGRAGQILTIWWCNPQLSRQQPGTIRRWMKILLTAALSRPRYADTMRFHRSLVRHLPG